MKKCSDCQTLKPFAGFHKSAASADGHQYRCKACRAEKERGLYKERKAKWRAVNKSKRREYGASWAKSNPDKIRAAGRRYYQRHPEKQKARADAYRKSHPDQRHARDLETKYGISLSAYNSLLLSQGGHCALCPIMPEQNSRRRRLSVDHDHVTGRVRGLLCDKHNRAIGLFGDDPEMLMRAIEYLAEPLAIAA